MMIEPKRSQALLSASQLECDHLVVEGELDAALVVVIIPRQELTVGDVPAQQVGSKDIKDAGESCRRGRTAAPRT